MINLKHNNQHFRKKIKKEKTTTKESSPQQTNSQDISNLDPKLREKYEKLKKQEDDLNKREAIYDQRQQILVDREKLQADKRPINWPRCFPIIHHDIVGDIQDPETFPVVRMVYWHWYFFIACLFWNVITSLSVLIVIPDGAEGATFALSVVFLVFLPPLGFLFYRILYRAGRKEKAALYLVYLCFLTLEMIVWLFFMIGPPSSGAVGFYIIKQTFAKSVAVGIIIIINVVFLGRYFCLVYCYFLES